MGYVLKESIVAQFSKLNEDMHMDMGPHLEILHGFSEDRVHMLLNAVEEVEDIKAKEAQLLDKSLGLKTCSACGRIYSVSNLFAAAGGSSPKYCLNCGARFVKKPPKA